MVAFALQLWQCCVSEDMVPVRFRTNARSSLATTFEANPSTTILPEAEEAASSNSKTETGSGHCWLAHWRTCRSGSTGSCTSLFSLFLFSSSQCQRCSEERFNRIVPSVPLSRACPPARTLNHCSILPLPRTFISVVTDKATCRIAVVIMSLNLFALLSLLLRMNRVFFFFFPILYGQLAACPDERRDCQTPFFTCTLCFRRSVWNGIAGSDQRDGGGDGGCVWLIYLIQCERT